MADVVEGRATWYVAQADCIWAMSGIPDGCVDHVVTDPPYEAEAHTKARRTRAAMEGRGPEDYAIRFAAITPEIRTAAGAEFARLARRWMLVFCQVEGANMWKQSIGEARYVRTMVWVKPDSTPQLTGDRPAQGFETIVAAHTVGRKRWNGGGRRGVFTHLVNPPGRTRTHETEKPEALMLELVELFTDPSDLILDPFGGSGTTGVAALRQGRRFIGIELNQEHAETARERLRAEAGMSTLQARKAGQRTLFEVAG